MPDLGGRTTQHGDFQTMTLAQMHMQAGNHQFMVMMLLVDQPGSQFAGMMVINQSDHGHLLPLNPFGLFLDERISWAGALGAAMMLGAILYLAISAEALGSSKPLTGPLERIP